jgi:DNA excision repair protein ERCC-4
MVIIVIRAGFKSTVLSPTMALERKSVSDLVGSLNNGRLYTQAEALSMHYTTPLLLIEFQAEKSFSLQVRTQ